MIIRRKPVWELPESSITPARFVLGRRKMVAGALAMGPLSALGAARAAHYDPGRPITPEHDATTYNNYYEFSDDKNIWQAAQALPQAPWSIKFDGLVEKPQTWALEDLLKQVTLEDRAYRHRCVEAWAMTVPWRGFPLSRLVALARPLASAKYVQFQTITNNDAMPGLANPVYPFPYTEAVTIEEAANILPFIATGLYGKPLPPQNGGPIRLVLPWKYGFKSAKALVRVSFTEKRPETFWRDLNPNEYGFWANVNPDVPHPRWSQAHERLLGSGEIVPTRIYNGYGDQVAQLYAGLQNEMLFR